MEPIPGAQARSGVRVAARILLVDPAQRLLLFQGFDPHVPDESFWFTAGGGLEPGEELLAGAVRELREETGMQVPPERLAGPVWLRRVQFSFEGVEYDSDEWVFLAALADAAVVDTAGFTDLEKPDRPRAPVVDGGRPAEHDRDRLPAAARRAAARPARRRLGRAAAVDRLIPAAPWLIGSSSTPLSSVRR